MYMDWTDSSRPVSSTQLFKKAAGKGGGDISSGPGAADESGKDISREDENGE